MLTRKYKVAIGLASEFLNCLSVKFCQLLRIRGSNWSVSAKLSNNFLIFGLVAIFWLETKESHLQLYLEQKNLRDWILHRGKYEPKLSPDLSRNNSRPRASLPTHVSEVENKKIAYTAHTPNLRSSILYGYQFAATRGSNPSEKATLSNNCLLLLTSFQ